MATDTPSHAGDSSNDRSTVTAFVSVVARLVADLIVVTCWVVFLTLLFLENGWPRWVFYTALVSGIGLYVLVTARWL